MAFSKFADDQGLLILDQASNDIGTFNPNKTTRLEACDVYFYKQGAFNSTVLSITLLNGASPVGSGSVNVSQIDQLGTNIIGKIRVEFNDRVNVVSGTSYTIRVSLTNYSPTITEGQVGDTYISILRDWPITMTYTATSSNFSSEPIAINFYEAV